MKTKKFKQPWRNPIEFVCGKSDEPDMCIPDQSYTIREILNQFTSGLTPPLNQYEDYDGDDPDFDEIDVLKLYDDISDVKAEHLRKLEKYYGLKRKEAELREYIRATEAKGTDNKDISEASEASEA